MSTVRERAAENATEITSSLIVGLGLLALFTGWSPIPFWVIFAVGFAVVVPTVARLAGEEERSDERNDRDGQWKDSERHYEEPSAGADTEDALETLRERYARGDLTDDQFERKLDTLLETDSPENAADWRHRERERIEEES
ncbi:SHOCT domain-containing protein [Halococcus dombrowskii]|uniref:SHOCT domain-containing protein n=1 Tax=Halococcus dombrowskii TaxID=179637 RepID=A0AAV3SER2_HALDO|nr:SHOCT domain-containing protein [Halococcus dombrowskii]UOO95732.1 SHOCT domain-containing protein [Halococcus dombrowskii]